MPCRVVSRRGRPRGRCLHPAPDKDREEGRSVVAYYRGQRTCQLRPEGAAAQPEAAESVAPLRAIAVQEGLISPRVQAGDCPRITVEVVRVACIWSRSGLVSADGCIGKGPGRMAGPLRGNEPVLNPMYAKKSRRPPPSRPFLNLLRSLVYLPLRSLVRALASLPTVVVGAFCNTRRQCCQAASQLPSSRAATVRSRNVTPLADPLPTVIHTGQAMA